MSSHILVTNRGDAPIHVQAMSRDTDGRFTHAYVVQVEPGKSKTFSSEQGTRFMVHEQAPEHGVLLPRGVPPADVEKPDDVPVDKDAAAEVEHVADATAPDEAVHLA